MIDIKAIKNRAESIRYLSVMVMNKHEVYALCHEIERLQGELRRSESLIEQYREEAAHRDNPDDYVMQY